MIQTLVEDVELVNQFRCFSIKYTGLNIGGFSYFEDAPRKYFLQSFMIQEAYRGRGIGSIVLSKLIDILKQRNCDCLQLHCFTSRLSFYMRNGFEIRYSNIVCGETIYHMIFKF